MNKFIRVLLLIFVLSLPSYAFASPVYLTLQGTVGRINDPFGAVRAAGINSGSLLKYVVTIDSELPGTVTYPQWNNLSLVQAGTSYSAVKGYLSGFQSKQSNYIEQNTPSWSHYYPTYTAYAGSDFSTVIIKSNISFFDLKPGSTISGMYEETNTDCYWADRIYLDKVTVTDVSTTSPTPLPGALLLMGGGLGLVGLIRRKFAKKS